MPTTSTATTTTDTPAPSTAAAVLAALAAGPASAAEIARRADIARSSATKTLAALAAADRVVRTAGGRDAGRRLPDCWSLPAATPTAPATATPTPTPTLDAAGTPVPPPRARLGSGELGAHVSAYLREHPGEHSPTAIAAALGGRSAGAIGNALVRLVARGEAAETAQAPRRYQGSAH